MTECMAICKNCKKWAQHRRVTFGVWKCEYCGYRHVTLRDTVPTIRADGDNAPDAAGEG